MKTWATGGTGTFTQSGGTNTVSGDLYLGRFSGSSGTYNLNGGTLQTPNVQRGGGSGSGTFNFNGGTLRAAASATTFLEGLTAANVQAGGARVDTNGFNVTIAQPLLHDPALGATMDGGLLKTTGTGTLTLTAPSTFTGPTVVSAGTLALDVTPGTTNGRLTATGAITVNNGGTLLLGGALNVTDRLNNAAPVALAGGGTLVTGGLQEGAAPTGAGGAGGAMGLGALTLTSTSAASRATFDFGNTAAGSALVFSSLDALGKGAFVSILGFTGTANGISGDNGTSTFDRLLFVNNPGFTAADLANWQFRNDVGDLVADGGAQIAYNGYFEIVPVPEPGTWLAGLLAAGALIRYRHRRRPKNAMSSRARVGR